MVLAVASSKPAYDVLDVLTRFISEDNSGTDERYIQLMSEDHTRAVLVTELEAAWPEVWTEITSWV